MKQVSISLFMTIMSFNFLIPASWSQEGELKKVVSPILSQMTANFPHQGEVNLVKEKNLNFPWNFEVIDQGHCQMAYVLSVQLPPELDFGSFYDIKKDNGDLNEKNGLFVITRTGFLVKDKSPESFSLAYYSNRERLKKLFPNLVMEQAEKVTNFEKYNAIVPMIVGPFTLSEIKFEVHLEEYNQNDEKNLESFASFKRPIFAPNDLPEKCEGELGCSNQTVCIAISQVPPFTRYAIAMSQFFPAGKNGEHSMVVNHQITCMNKNALPLPLWILDYPISNMTDQNLRSYMGFLREE